MNRNKRIVLISLCAVLLAAGVIALVRETIFESPPLDDEPLTPVIASSVQPVQITQTEITNTETVSTVTAQTTPGATTVTTAPPQTETSRSTRNIVTSRERKIYDTNSVYIDMENILQLPELPTGCEITALTTLLRFYGFDADKVDLATNYLPVSWGNYNVDEEGRVFKDSFFEYFIGDPAGRGYGCFSPAIVKAAESYIADNGGGYDVVNISGCNPDEMYDLLTLGTPVLCWATDGMIAPEYYESWYDNATGEKLDWYLNEHAFVLAGFNMSAGLITLNDPMKGIIDYNMTRFETRFNEMYSQAIYLRVSENDYSNVSDVTSTVSIDSLP
jgi:uncharacterized protein YvpB